MHHNTQIEFPSSPREIRQAKSSLEGEKIKVIGVCANLFLVIAFAMVVFLSNVDSIIQ